MRACLLSGIAIGPAEGAADIEAARRLFRAYADWLAVDLCFRGFEAELRELPGAYAPPGGRLLLARAGGTIAGCVALRPLEPGICEMKRLWVEPGFAGHGIGRALAERLLAEAREAGHRTMRLDTIPARMPAARHLYHSLGFRDIPGPGDTPLDGTVTLERGLD